MGISLLGEGIKVSGGGGGGVRARVSAQHAHTSTKKIPSPAPHQNKKQCAHHTHTHKQKTFALTHQNKKQCAHHTHTHTNKNIHTPAPVCTHLVVLCVRARVRVRICPASTKNTLTSTAHQRHARTSSETKHQPAQKYTNQHRTYILVTHTRPGEW